jgi:hypothetical protein
MFRWCALLAVLGASVASANPFQRVVVQRADAGVVSDCYIWEESPNYNGGSSDTLYTGPVGSTDKRAFLRFDVSSIPREARVLRAWVTLTVSSNGGVPTRVHRVTKPWTELEPTWATFADEFDPAVEATFTPVPGRVSFDLTELVAAWVSGQRSNFGVLLEQDTMTASSTYRSSDWEVASERPELEIVYENVGPLVTDAPPDLSAACEVPLTYSLKAHAPRANRFTLAPQSTAELDPRSGVFTWTPTREELGAFTFSVKADDGVVTEEFTLGRHRGVRARAPRRAWLLRRSRPRGGRRPVVVAAAPQEGVRASSAVYLHFPPRNRSFGTVDAFAIIGLVGLSIARWVPIATLIPFWGCGFRKLTGVPCPGCGLTRVADRVAHLNVLGALKANPLGTVAALFFAACIVASVAHLAFAAASPSW